MDTRRLILFVIFSFSIMMLWDAWQQKDRPAITTQQGAPQASPEANNGAVAGDVVLNTATANNAVIDGEFKLEKGQRIKVSTDLFEAEIDTSRWRFTSFGTK